MSPDASSAVLPKMVQKCDLDSWHEFVIDALHMSFQGLSTHHAEFYALTASDAAGLTPHSEVNICLITAVESAPSYLFVFIQGSQS